MNRQLGAASQPNRLAPTRKPWEERKRIPRRPQRLKMEKNAIKYSILKR